MLPFMYVILKGMDGNIDQAINELDEADGKVEYYRRNLYPMCDGSDLGRTVGQPPSTSSVFKPYMSAVYDPTIMTQDI